MDELELLKKDWVKSDDKFEKKSASQIYPMLLKKSSSIVKTLFYISIAELVFILFCNFIPFFVSEDYKNQFNETYNNGTFHYIILGLSYVVIVIFIYLLYKSYKTISVVDSTKQLMKNILKTRKIIKYYVVYNLFMIVVMAPYYTYLSLKTKRTEFDVSALSTIELSKFIGVVTLLTLITVGIVYAFYSLIYGILLKRLNRNYKELKKIEI
ncbi:hypothetical protein DZC78_05425 [Olleya aquimaris]|uniref:Uncharacterized protein n=1 Tax=Olleya sediminilitoris TaxID=2795739 RepID=A0ABS1WJN3_9FLAO|nr:MULTISPECIES: hypothetical protein [Olleya]AXO79851.1 hypothetical protein DZC78_05425 [Olleya aquimaris]MBL7559311.1 hypothetical protein [Olleya sediminilitoris]